MARARPTHEPCRRCGASLKRADHLVAAYETKEGYVYDRNLQRERIQTYRSSIYRHTPCPACGDPQPLNSWWRKLRFLLAGAALVAISAGALYLFSSLG